MGSAKKINNHVIYNTQPNNVLSIIRRKDRFTFSIENMPQNIEEPNAATLTEIPEGFTVRVGPGDKEYLVPQYMIPALDQAFAAYHHKTDLNVLNAEPEVRQIP